MTNWIKASEKMPEVGKLVIARDEWEEFHTEANDYMGKYIYAAGYVEEEPAGMFIHIHENKRLPYWIEDSTEWQYVEE